MGQGDRSSDGSYAHAESLNEVTNLGVYCQTDTSLSTAARDYPETQGGTLWVSPAADSVLQEYTVNNGHKYVRSNPRGAWGAWQRVDALNLTDILIGVPIAHPLSTVPAGCLAMNGQRFDTRRYPKLAQKYPSGVLPDLRGEFIRGWDNGRGVDAGRALLNWQNDDDKQRRVDFSSTDIGGFKGAFNARNIDTSQTKVDMPGDPYLVRQSRISNANGQRVYTYKTDGVGLLGAIQPGNDTLYKYYVSLQWGNGDQTRPRNIAFHYICLAA